VIITKELIINIMVTNRVQSAYPRSSTNVQSDFIQQRPTTSTTIRRSHTDVFDQSGWRTLESSTSLETRNSRQRPKTTSISSTRSTQVSVRKLHSDEIENLLRSLDRDDTFIVKVDCLANYRKLVQTINLRKTPLDCKSLCALQQRENRIVQDNACRDTRFRSLLDVLSPLHVPAVEKNDANDPNHNKILEYQLN
jgi:hypothetical protein